MALAKVFKPSKRKTIVAVPIQIGSIFYDGTEKSPTWQNFNPKQLTISGDISATVLGTYTAVFTPKKNCFWADGTQNPVGVEWSIEFDDTSFAVGKNMLVSNTMRFGTDFVLIGDSTDDVEQEVSQ